MFIASRSTMSLHRSWLRPMGSSGTIDSAEYNADGEYEYRDAEYEYEIQTNRQ